VVNKERLIDLLQEKRTALISRAVTEGLDPNVAMKDSSVEWPPQIIASSWMRAPVLKRETESIETSIETGRSINISARSCPVAGAIMSPCPEKPQAR